jgi:hypothetical protein
MTLRIVATAGWRQVFLLLATPIAMAVLSAAQTGRVPKDFSVTLERTGCVGSCPGYKVTILADGSVHYDGLYYVQAEGVRSKTIPTAKVEKVAQVLRDDHFFDWEGKQSVCLDFPVVYITALMNGNEKHVLEGCNQAGDVLTLARTIDKVAGTERWVGKVR